MDKSLHFITVLPSGTGFLGVSRWGCKKFNLNNVSGELVSESARPLYGKERFGIRTNTRVCEIVGFNFHAICIFFHCSPLLNFKITHQYGY